MFPFGATKHLYAYYFSLSMYPLQVLLNVSFARQKNNDNNSVWHTILLKIFYMVFPLKRIFKTSEDSLKQFKTML